MNSQELHVEIQRELRRDLGRAQRLVRRFERYVARNGTPHDRALAVFERAQLEHVATRLGRAKVEYARARAMFARLRAGRFLLACEVGAIQVLAVLGERRSALAGARRIRGLDPSGIRGAVAELAIGRALYELSELRRAEAAFRAAVRHLGRRRRSPAPVLRAQARVFLGITLGLRGAVGEALRQVRAAEHALDRLDAPADRDTATHTRGWLLGIRGNASAALGVLDEAAAAFGRRNDVRRLSLVELDRALIQGWLGDSRGAAKTARAAAARLRRMGAVLEAARAQIVAAFAERGHGRAGACRRLARQARTAFVAAGDRVGRATADTLLETRLSDAERILRREGHWLAAIEALLSWARSVPAAKGAKLLRNRLPDYPRVLATWMRPHLLGLQASASGTTERVALLRAAFRSAEGLRDRAPSTRLRATALAAHLPLYAELAEALIERGRLRDRREAFLVLDAARARTLREESSVDRTFDRPAIRVLRDRLEHLWRLLESSEAGPADLRRPRMETIRDVAACERALMDAVQSARGAPRSGGPRSELPATPTLAYAVLRGRLVGSIASHGDVDTWDCGSMRAIGHTVQRFRFQVTRRLFGSEDQRGADADLAALAAHLLRGAPEIPTKRLVVVVPPELGSVPMEALPYRGRLFGDDRTVVYAPWACAATVELARPRSALVVGIGGDELPEIRHEVAFVARTLRGADVLEGASAARETVLAALGGRDLVHVAAHARAREDVPPLSALRVHDGWLAACDLPADLSRAVFVLSGCRTGDPGMRWHGEAMAGFPRALLAAGVGAVVASRWEVTDDVAHRWMRFFYEELNRTNVFDAATTAGRRMRRRFPHPADWASFLAIRGGR